MTTIADEIAKRANLDRTGEFCDCFSVAMSLADFKRQETQAVVTDKTILFSDGSTLQAHFDYIDKEGELVYNRKNSYIKVGNTFYYDNYKSKSIE